MPLQQHLQLPKLSTQEGRRVENMLVALGASLDTKYGTYKSARYDKEREWERSIIQYEGEWDVDDLTKIEQALSASGGASDPVSVNITRPKTNVAIARMKDIQFPTGGDFNFFMKPAPLTLEIKQALDTPEPDGAMQIEAAQAGMPAQNIPSPQEMAMGVVEQNAQALPKMERALRNRMIYADYGKKARLAIEDLCIKGTGVVKGPTIAHKKYNRYSSATTSEGKEIQVLEEEFIPEPDVMRVDPLFFFPDPSARLPGEISDCFELHPMSETELADLSRNPAFMPEQIKKVLLYEPDATNVPSIVQRTSRDGSSSNVNNRWWIREYNGLLDKTVLHEAKMISDKDFEDPTKLFRGEVWFTNKTVIRFSLAPIDGQEGLPYGLSTWEKDPNSVFGHGVPHLLRDAQRVVNNAYLMLLDNASLTSGPQIVLNKEMIEPANAQDYAIEPHKVWFLTEFGVDVREVMQFVNIPSQMEGISQILDTAMQFADVESSTPLIQQGDVPTGNNTTTGLAMVMSATNIIQKAASMDWDDNITKPLVQRFYHYEMQYGDDPSVKGDFEVEVGGATERIEAEIRAQEIERMLGLASSSEEYMDHVDANKAFRALVDNTRTGDVLRSQEEVDQLVAQREQEAAQQQQSDPDALRAQAALISAEAKREEIQGRIQLDQQRLQKEYAEMQARYTAQMAEAKARQNEAVLAYQTELMKMANERESTVAKLQSELQMNDVTNATKLDIKEMDFEKFEREVEVKHQYGEGI